MNGIAINIFWGTIEVLSKIFNLKIFLLANYKESDYVR